MSGIVFAFDYDVERDMGECVKAPYNGKNCVAISYLNSLQTVGESKAMVEQQLQSFETLANEQKLAPIKRQYSSFSMDTAPTYTNEISYKLKGRVTYVLENPERANAFIALLKKSGYEAQNVEDLFKNSQCDMHAKSQ